MPIFDYLGHVVAALTVPYVPQRAATVPLETVRDLAIEAGRTISIDLGAGSRERRRAAGRARGHDHVAGKIQPPGDRDARRLGARGSRAGTRISVGGHHFARLPIALLTSIVDNGVKDLNYFAWAGGLPLELLLEAEAVASIDICFSSLDIFGLAPNFRDVAENRQLPINDWPALTMIQGLRAAQQNLPFMPVQLPEGSTMMERCPAVHFHRDERTGRRRRARRGAVIDTVLLHAPRADTDGNVEIYGARALDLPIVGAARQVLVTVDEIVPAGTLRHDGRQTISPATSSPPSPKCRAAPIPPRACRTTPPTIARIREILDGKHGTLRAALEKPADAPPAILRKAAKVPPETVVPAPFRNEAPRRRERRPIDELMAVRIARMLDNESFASAGAVSPLGNVAFRLAKATHAPDLFIGTFSCGHVDVAPGTMTLCLLEAMDCGFGRRP